ncbi:RNA 2'-phosphotransferase [Pirellulimonas nuda]|uniref:Probable RNA 2'-phosphotransferase n=1 Tax=Pirellulimonas nuda TaxID=2528009 RepID=A0A518DFV8_9BACT|nr:RNA 2'-phosphotransferase [Pirellulimonas nuda]QDU90348.1 RNA 2'-phosphotransferase [Pirellulimonas nuda]
MNEQALRRISKRLSLVLRHRPDSVGLSLQEGGWLPVGELLDALARAGTPVPLAVLKQVVAENDKQRFELAADDTRIRARQGHSTQVDLGYLPAAPPELLYHGTATRYLGAILKHGLQKMRRHHVHLSTCQETMLKVAVRHGSPVLLSVDSAGMSAAGHEFFVTGNQVWLTERVPPEFLAVLEEQ